MKIAVRRISTRFGRAARAAALLALAALFPAAARAVVSDEQLVEKPLAQITDQSIGALGRKALSIRPTEWRHAESANFVYHYFTPFIAQGVAVEAEFYYRVIARELEKDTAQWERKCHIFIFEDEADWALFQKAGGLEPWTGGIHAQGQLVIQRNRERKFKGNSLAHEVTHLVVNRFFGDGVPLWVNEGLAEYSASRWYASFYKAHGYAAHPRSTLVAEGNYLPLRTLTTLATYPEQVEVVMAFYAESERLVRFLSAADKHGFIDFLDALSKGNRFDTALEKGYAAKFTNAESLESAFKPYAGSDQPEAAK